MAIKNTCAECPFKKTAAPGYLGNASHEPELFLSHMNGAPMPCHMTIKDWDNDKEVAKKSWSHTCVGSLKFLRNTLKLPRDSDYSKLVYTVEKDPAIFETRQDFCDHHQ